MKTYKTRPLWLALGLGLAMWGAQATPILGTNQITPLIVSGAPPDSPAARVDANVPTSPLSGVVSINIRYDNQSYICSGTLVSRRHVVTAGHCVDTNGQGSLIDISQPFAQSGRDVRVVFNAEPNPGDPGRAVMTAAKVSMHPDYKGFGVCPAGVQSFCVNDDVAVITLGADAPASARHYGMSAYGMAEGLQIMMAGYGTSGDGWGGYTVGPSFRIKRSGQNIVDLFEGDDEQFTGFDSYGFLQGGANEVWYADFDGVNSSGQSMDSACTYFGRCTPSLANDIEANIGGGDSGGPSFITGDNGELLLVGNNTFGWSGFGQENNGAFGHMFGGMNLAAYIGYLNAATDGHLRLISAPGSLALAALALMGLGAVRRRGA